MASEIVFSILEEEEDEEVEVIIRRVVGSVTRLNVITIWVIGLTFFLRYRK